MKELVIISGKGGTGKTSIAACFAALAENAVLADCDVDAADLHLILKPTIKQTRDFVGGKRAEITTEKCIGCGKCRQLCRFDAITFNGPSNQVVQKTFTIDPVLCEGCGVCTEFCPAEAIELKDCINGRWFISETRFGPMVHGELGIAEQNSGKLVTLIRNKAGQIAQEQDRDLIIVDGAPGIGCPVIASIAGADMVLIITEPTLSGKHDLHRVAELAANFGIPALVCINKADINPQIADDIEKESQSRSLAIAGRIRYDNAFTKAQIAESAVIEYTDGAVSGDIKALWGNINTSLGKENKR